MDHANAAVPGMEANFERKENLEIGTKKKLFQKSWNRRQSVYEMASDWPSLEKDILFQCPLESPS